MKIIRNGVTYKLTAEEIREAYLEEQAELLKEDAACQLSDHIQFDELEDDAIMAGEFREKYGFDAADAFEEDSPYYLIPKLVADYEKACDCNIAENDLWKAVISNLLGTIQEKFERAMSVYQEALWELIKVE